MPVTTGGRLVDPARLVTEAKAAGIDVDAASITRDHEVLLHKAGRDVSYSDATVQGIVDVLPSWAPFRWEWEAAREAALARLNTALDTTTLKRASTLAEARDEMAAILDRLKLALHETFSGPDRPL